jgi:uncharacterized YigZ family protein
LKKVTNSTTDSFREKGSKFIGYLYPVGFIEEFEEKLEEIKSKYPDATHHCYAWRLNPVNIREFAQDDGEPSGTAGLPILNSMKSHKVINGALIVVRYYGGTKLGKSGLIAAYSRAAELCLRKATLTGIQRVENMEINYPYAEQNTIEQLKYRYELKELDSEYGESVRLRMACPLKFKNIVSKKLHNLNHRGIQIELLGESFL